MTEEEVKVYMLLKGFRYYSSNSTGSTTASWKMSKDATGEHLLYFRQRKSKFSYTANFDANYDRYNNDNVKECMENLND